MAKSEEQDSKEYKRPDAAKAFEIYDQQIAPKMVHMNTIKGDLSQPYDDIKQYAHFPRKVLNFIIAIENEDDDTKRDHLLLALAEGLKHRGLFLPRDLVTMADGEDGGAIVPTGERDGDMLATLDDDDDFDEASAEELAAQEGRRKPASGTGAAAIAAMKQSAEAGTSGATVN